MPLIAMTLTAQESTRFIRSGRTNNVTRSSLTATSSVFNSCILYLQDSLQSIDYGALSQAIDLLSGSRRFIFAASGDAHFIAASAAQKFMRIGYQTTASSDFDSQLIALSQMTPEDALICISHSGKTRNICSLAKVAREHVIKVITITNFPGAPLAKHSDILLLTASFSYDVMDEVLAKRVPALCLLDTLYLSVLMKKKSSLQPLIDNVNEYLSLNRH
ncbi:MurR/RpiR family transcriptional regulator [Faecalicatena contorta]|uniref:MurR/RpiR family transcriptional regulator n=1 Tax=Faecalicatena contorta TaxID=39482 RepID=UPI00189C249A|nr:MurR/RpiR family transcriptional regulator [Faecalicatena contorta]